MRNALIVLTALALFGCARASVQSHARHADGATGPAIGAATASHGASIAAPGRSTAALSRGVLAAVNARREPAERYERRPCTIPILRELEIKADQAVLRDGAPKIDKVVSVPCTTRCPGERSVGRGRVSAPHSGI